MPPRPIPSLKILLIWRIVLLVFSDPLFVTSYIWSITSIIVSLLNRTISTTTEPISTTTEPNLIQTHFTFFSLNPNLLTYMAIGERRIEARFNLGILKNKTLMIIICAKFSLSNPKIFHSLCEFIFVERGNKRESVCLREKKN